MDDSTDWLDELEEPDMSYWAPDPGDTLIGHLLEVRNEEGKFGTHEVAVLETDDDVVAVRLEHTVLLNEWKAKSPRVGETLAIRFVGQVPKKSGTGSYFGYKVAVNRPVQVVADQAYDDVLADDEPEDEPEEPWGASSSDQQSA